MLSCQLLVLIEKMRTWLSSKLPPLLALQLPALQLLLLQLLHSAATQPCVHTEQTHAMATAQSPGTDATRRQLWRSKRAQ